jgi:hypothetical protein
MWGTLNTCIANKDPHKQHSLSFQAVRLIARIVWPAAAPPTSLKKDRVVTARSIQWPGGIKHWAQWRLR